MVLDKDTVCDTVVPENSPFIETVLVDEMLTQTRVCDEFLGFCSSPKVTTYTIADYTARVLADKPASIINDDF